MVEKNTGEEVTRGRTEGETDGLMDIGKHRGERAAAAATRLLV